MCGETAARAPRAAPRADETPEGLPRHGPARAIEEERRAVAPHLTRADGGEVAAHPVERPRARGHEALPVPLANHHHVARPEVHVLDPQPEGLGGAEPRGVQQLQQRAVPQTVRPGRVGRLDERGRVRHGQGAGQPPRWTRAVQVQGRIARHAPGVEEEAVEAAHR